MLSSDDLSPFVEGGCSYPMLTMAEDNPHITMQHITKF